MGMQRILAPQTPRLPAHPCLARASEGSWGRTWESWEPQWARQVTKEPGTPLLLPGGPRPGAQGTFVCRGLPGPLARGGNVGWVSLAGARATGSEASGGRQAMNEALGVGGESGGLEDGVLCRRGSCPPVQPTGALVGVDPVLPDPPVW